MNTLNHKRITAVQSLYTTLTECEHFSAQDAIEYIATKASAPRFYITGAVAQNYIYNYINRNVLPKNVLKRRMVEEIYERASEFFNAQDECLPICVSCYRAVECPATSFFLNEKQIRRIVKGISCRH